MIARARDFRRDILHVPRRQELPFLHIDGAACGARGQQQIRLAAQKSRDLQYIYCLGRGRALFSTMYIGQHGQPRRRAHIRQNGQAFLHANAAGCGNARAIGLVEG